MRKLITLILTVCVVFAFYADVSFAAEKTDYTESWSTLNGLGIVSYDDSQKDEFITRAEFADVIANALNIKSNSAYDDLSKAEGFKDVIRLFGDVESTDENYYSIKAVCDFGIMKGDINGNFYPNKGLKYEEAIKTFVSLLGYENEALLKGGWFSGYYRVAEQLKITLPDVSEGRVLSKSEAAEMFFKAFHVEVNEVDKISKGNIYYKSNGDKTFLSECLNIGFAEGQVTSVENSSLTSKNLPVLNSITIDDVVIKNTNKIRTNNYLGRIVKAYYDISGNDNLLYITYSDSDDVIIISADDFDSCESGIITYYSGNRKKSVNISSYPVIYNGVSLPSYNSETFDIEYGSIIITKNDYENVVIIRDYKDMIISSVSKSDKMIYDEDTGKSVSLDDSDCIVCITDVSNKQISVDDIKYGMSASVIDGENYKEVYLYDSAVKGTLESFDITNRKITVSGKEYGISISAANKLNNTLLNTDVQIYVNMFGDVFYMSSISKDILGGVLADVDKDGATPKVKIFGDDGKFHLYEIDKNVKIYTSASTSPVKAKGDIDGSAALNGYRGYITYKIKGEKIKEIQIPLESRTLKQDGDGRTALRTVEIGPTNSWDYDFKSIGKDVFFDASVKIYSVPNDRYDSDGYKLVDYRNITPYEMFGGQVETYYDDFDDPIPEAVVLKNYKIEDSHIRIISNISVVKKIRDGGDENGNNIKTAVIVDTKNDEYTVFSRETATDSSGNSCTAFDAASNFVDGEKIKVDAGDIIIYDTFYGTNEISKVRIIYDCDKTNMPGGKKGYLSAAVTGTDMYYALNSTYNIISNWDPYAYSTVSDMISGKYITGADLTRQNPIRIQSGIVSGNDVIERLGTNGHASYNGGYQIMLGYVTDKTDAFVKLTTQDLSVLGAVYSEDGMPSVQIPNPASANPESYTGFYHQSYYRYVNTNGYILLIEYFDRGINIRKATPNDIMSYKTAGAEASRVLAYPHTGRYFIINDYRSR